MALDMDASPGWVDLPDSMWEGDVYEDYLVALNSLIRMAACSTEFEYGGGVSGNLAGETIGVGDGSTVEFAYTLAHVPALPGTLRIVAGSRLVTDDGAGDITGLGIASGSTINYETGALTLYFSTAPALNQVITCCYFGFVNAASIASEAVGTGDGSTVTFAHTLATTIAAPGTVVIRAGTIVGDDNGLGVIAGTGILAGTVNYQTGAVSVTFAAAPAADTAITAAYDQATVERANPGELIGTGNGTKIYWTYTTKYQPILPGSAVIAIGTTFYSDNGAGVISGPNLQAGTIDYTTGAIALNFDTALPAIAPNEIVLVYIQPVNEVTMLEDGDTVPLFESLDDGYEYSQSEVLFPHAMAYSPDFLTGVNSGGGNVLQYYAYVQQDTGSVGARVNYYIQGAAETMTKDGAIQVLCFARRGSGPIQALAGVRTNPLGSQGDPLTQGGTVSLQ